MYQSNRLNFRHDLAAVPPHMPIDILLALPEYVTGPENVAYLFNLPGAINDLMGGAGWESAAQVMKPYVWAPQWNNEQLMKFAADPFGSNKHPFPQLNPDELRPTRGEFEIIHFIGSISIQEDELPALNFGCDAIPPVFSVKDLKRELIGLGTRLIILQNPVFLKEVAAAEKYLHRASQFAESIIAAGGPAVLVIAGADQPELVNTYLTDFYANIVHNQPLSAAAQPKPEIDSRLWVELFVGEGGEEILLISRLRDELYSKIENIRLTVEPMVGASLGTELDQMKPYLHTSQLRAIKSHAKETGAFELEEEVSERASRVLDSTRKMRMDLDYSHESGAAIPLGESSRAMPMVEAESTRLETIYPAVAELRSELNTQASKAPRVLNAGFADPRAGRVLNPREPLVAGQEYDLIIDVGPRWSTIPSLVTGNENWPESALPPDKKGYPIHVVFISDDTEPKLFSSWIWVPRHTGRSFPYNLSNQKKASDSGPIAFRIKAPSLKASDANLTKLHGRLCLYYMNNLLQSARVEAGVARTPNVVLEVDNVVDVDYVISGTVQDLDQFATRKLSFTEDAKVEAHPITLNLTLNDDGKAHRVLVRQLDELPTAPLTNNSPVGWTPFDPADARDALNDAREILKSCFYKRDEQTGNPIESKPGLDDNKAKTKNQFLWDLLILAKLGDRLFNTAFTGVTPDGQWATRAEWSRALQQRLETSSIIQVSRTGPANYVFPWGLIYNYPLSPDAQIKFCRVTTEWTDDGKRTKPLATSCPYRNENWHVENIVCPYGFWGLNHIIEQPVSALHKLPDGTYVLDDATDEIVMNQADLDLSVSVTRDIQLQIDIDAHLERLGQMKPMRIYPPDPAEDTDEVREMLKSATIVYFLCHGEYDGRNPFLSIGLRDDNQIHRIYPQTLQNWARTPTLAGWQKQRPLIFINGCHTANLKPGEVLNFVTALSFAGASGVIGTEVSVLAPVAIEISELVFKKMVEEKMPVGQAMYQTRWELANKGNLLGLAYTLYCLANLHITKS